MDISWCRDSSYKPIIICKDFCLFDIDQDPCETRNIIQNINLKYVVMDLKMKLQKYWLEFEPQTNGPVNLRSDPSSCNNTWYTWIDGVQSCVLGLDI